MPASFAAHPATVSSRTRMLRNALALALGLSGASVFATPTLLGFYTFENANGSLWNVVDQSGNGKNAVSVASNGSATVTTGGQGYEGEAARFTPTSGNMPNAGFEVAIDIGPSLGDLTIGGWLKRIPTVNTSNGGPSGMAGYGLNTFFGSDNGCWDRGLWYGSQGWEITGKNGCAGPTRTGVTMTDNEWHFVLVSYSGITASLYIDGVFKASADSYSTGGGSPRLRLGAFDGSATTEPWDGLIDNVFIMRNALNASQVADLNAQGAAGVYRLAGLQPPGAVPVPGTLALVGLALLAGAAVRRRSAR
jgi:hypothetical protein